MAFRDLFFGRKKPSAGVAKERLQIILAHERATDHEGVSSSETPSWLPELQQELMSVVARYIKISTDDLKVTLEKRDNMELLEINVTLPEKGEEVK